ncbi:MAG: beta-ketoacyl-[acyl-carrier-protein] synthase family protein [Bdellovibrionia bacterium]
MKRVAITGIGAVTPLGNTAAAFAGSLFEGRSGAARVTRFDPASLPTRFACEVKNFESEFRDIKISFAQTAAREAMRMAGLSSLGSNGMLSLGLGLELFSMDDLIASRAPGFEIPTDFRARTLFLNTPSDIAAHLIGREFGLENAPQIHISACAASTDALGTAFLDVREGRADIALAGGADSMINPMGLGGFCRIGALSGKNDSPTLASRPFDRDRDGFVLGEGGGFLVLENEEHARKRGAKILAFISGYGNSLDAYNISDPHPKGEGALSAMKRALRSADLTPADISAVSAHGTGTPKNDPAESHAIHALLGTRVSEVPVFATKSMIGHLISAGGAVETVAAVVCLQEQRLHPTANLENPAPEVQPLFHVRSKPMKHNLSHILKNSFAFGGQNACLVLSRGS